MLSWEQRKVVRVTFSSPSCQSPGRVLAYPQAITGPATGTLSEEDCDLILRRTVDNRKGSELHGWFQVEGRWTFNWDRRTGFRHRLGVWTRAPSELRFYNPIALSPFEVKTKPVREWSPEGYVKVASSAPRVFFLELHAAEGLERNPPFQAHPACWG